MYYTKVSGFSGKKKFGPEVVLPTQPHPARKASHRDQAAPRSNHLDPLAWPHSPLCLTVQKFSSLGLTYYFPQISSVFFFLFATL